MSNTQLVIERAERLCQSHGTRLTEKRKQVLTGLISSEKALSAYELVDFCKIQLGQSIPVMSVYRILDFLQVENLVHKLSLTNKYVACSHIACDHAHEVPQFLICNRCGKVKEIGIKKSLIESLTTSVEQAGYFLNGSQLELNCLCQSCANSSA